MIAWLSFWWVAVVVWKEVWRKWFARFLKFIATKLRTNEMTMTTTSVELPKASHSICYFPLDFQMPSLQSNEYQESLARWNFSELSGYVANIPMEVISRKLRALVSLHKTSNQILILRNGWELYTDVREPHCWNLTSMNPPVVNRLPIFIFVFAFHFQPH